MTGRSTKRAWVAALVAAGTLVTVATAAVGSPAERGDHFNRPRGTTVTFKNSGPITIAMLVNNQVVKITCAAFSASGTIGYGMIVSGFTGTPDLTGCTDSLGGTDTFHIAAGFQIDELDSGTETGIEPNPGSGDEFALNLQTNGLTFTSTSLPGCTIQFSYSIEGAFNDSTIWTVMQSPNRGVGTGCITGWAKVTWTFLVNPSLHDTP